VTFKAPILEQTEKFNYSPKVLQKLYDITDE